MKSNVLSCLFAASTVFSLQAVGLINETSQVIMVSDLGYFSRNHGTIYFPGELELNAHDEQDTGDLRVNVITARVNNDILVFQQLTQDDVITFMECRDGKIFAIQSKESDEI